MDRLLRIYRITSSPLAVALLVGVNLVPLVGAVFWGWDVWTLLVLYWVENGIVGVIAVLRMLIAQGPLDTRSGPQEAVSTTSRSVLIPFFIVHYGIFWVVHGVFVMSLPEFAGVATDRGRFPTGEPSGFPGGPFGDPMIGLRWDLIALGAVGLAISHGASFVLNYVGRGEYRTARLGLLMFSPYPRLVILHLTILAGGILSLRMGSPLGSMVVLVALKIALDLALHLREHRGLGRAASTPPAPPAIA